MVDGHRWAMASAEYDGDDDDDVMMMINSNVMLGRGQ